MREKRDSFLAANEIKCSFGRLTEIVRCKQNISDECLNKSWSTPFGVFQYKNSGKKFNYEIC